MRGATAVDALILSCSTGGGHNAAGRAMKEALEQRGHRAVMLDPYTLVGKNLDQKVGNTYVQIAQRTPRLFGAIYRLGNAYRRLPVRSPVYWANKRMYPVMLDYLSHHHFDVIIMTHLFPGEILTHAKVQGIPIPKTIMVATDYTCVPFFEESDCDAYCIPSEELREEYLRRGLPAEKLVSSGIPVRQQFMAQITREAAAGALGLDSSRRYILLSGGSIGAGWMKGALQTLCRYLQQHEESRLIVICGNNERLYRELRKRYGGNQQIILISTTDDMALYMRISDVYLSKPGGLSSTEAAVVGLPLIHLPPIPGCETKNRQFFSARNMSAPVDRAAQLLDALTQMQQDSYRNQMIANQRATIPQTAAETICETAERLSCSSRCLE